MSIPGGKKTFECMQPRSVTDRYMQRSGRNARRLQIVKNIKGGTTSAGNRQLSKKTKNDRRGKMELESRANAKDRNDGMMPEVNENKMKTLKFAMERPSAAVLMTDPQMLQTEKESRFRVKGRLNNRELSGGKKADEFQANKIKGENEASNVAAVADDVFSNLGDQKDWRDIISCLGAVESNVHHLGRTDTFLEDALDRFLWEIKQFENISKASAEKLLELIKLEKVFHKLSKLRAEEMASVEDSVDRSGSAESSRFCGKTLPPSEENNYSKKICGGIRCPEKTILKIYQRNGEIVFEGIRFSCNTVERLCTGRERRFFDRNCLICNLIWKKRVSRERRKAEISRKRWEKKTDFPNRLNLVSAVFLRSFTETPAAAPICLITRNDESSSGYDFVGFASCLCSQVSSGTDSEGNSFDGNFVSLTCCSRGRFPREAEETIGLDEAFNIRKKSLSLTDATRSDVTGQSDGYRREGVRKWSDKMLRFSGRYGGEAEPCETGKAEGKLSRQTFYSRGSEGGVKETETFTAVNPPGRRTLSEVICGEHSTEAGKHVCKMASGSSKFDVRRSAVGNGREWKLSSVIWEVGNDLAANGQEERGETRMLPCREAYASDGTWKEQEEETSDEYEEAMEDVQDSPKSDSDSETYYDMPQTRHHGFCAECGPMSWHKELKACLFCGKQVSEIPNGSLASQQQSCARDVKMLEDTRAGRASDSVEGLNIRSLVIATCPTIANLRNLTLTGNEMVFRKEYDSVDVFTNRFRKWLERDVPPLNAANGDPSSVPLTAHTIFGFQYSGRIGETEESREEGTENFRRKNRPSTQTKMEQVFKNEQRTALELEIFKQKLQVEGLVIKEKEDFLSCEEFERIPSLPEVPEIRGGASVCTHPHLKHVKESWQRLKSEESKPTTAIYPRLGEDAFGAGGQLEEPSERSDSESYTFEEASSADMGDKNCMRMKPPKFACASSDEESSDGSYCGTASSVTAEYLPRRMNAMAAISLTEATLAILGFYPATRLKFEESREEFFDTSSSGLSFDENERKRSRSSCPVRHGSTAAAECSVPAEAPSRDGKSQLPGLGTEREKVSEKTESFEVRLRTAIAILSRLESLLLEQVNRATKESNKPSTVMASSLSRFVSSANVLKKSLAEVCHLTDNNFGSEGRLRKILRLLTCLEDVLRMNEIGVQHRGRCSGKVYPAPVYDLFRPVDRRIRDIGYVPTEDATDVTPYFGSELQECTSPISPSAEEAVTGSNPHQPDEEELCREEIVKRDNKAVEGEFTNTDSARESILNAAVTGAMTRWKRVKKSFDRIERLQSENDESIKFLSTLVDKTLKRAGEMDETRRTLHRLTANIANVAVSPGKRNGTKERDVAAIESGNETADEMKKQPEADEGAAAQSPPTGSGSTIPLDAEKMPETDERRESEKEEIPAVIPDKLPVPDEFSGCEGTDDGGGKSRSRVTRLSRIGDGSLYLEWTKPETGLCSLSGYEIWVNGKLNSRVRNPDKLKAILYSVYPGEGTEIKLHALMDDGRRRSLTQVAYPVD